MLTRRRFVAAIGAAAASSCVSPAVSPAVSPTSAPASDARPSPTGARIAGARFDVRAFGAVGDGVADDAPAIRSAIRAATQGASGAVVYFPKGRYLLGRGTRIEAKRPLPGRAGDQQRRARRYGAHRAAEARHAFLRCVSCRRAVITRIPGLLLFVPDKAH